MTNSDDFKGTFTVDSYAQTILASLSAHIAIIDENGMILETNRAWRSFAQSNALQMPPETLNINYLDICDSATGESSEQSLEIAEGIRKVIQGELQEFVMDYPCHSKNERRWFYMRAIRANSAGPAKVVISHENITALKLAEEAVRIRERELEEKSSHLEEANAALRALIRQRDEDKKEFEQAVFQNIKEAVLPNLERLKQQRQTKAARELTELIEKDLHDIASPFLRHLTSLETILTPQEIQVANLIRQGKASKEIAEMLSLSVTTVSFHRKNLRQKFGLTHASTNLRTYLLSLN